MVFFNQPISTVLFFLIKLNKNLEMGKKKNLNSSAPKQQIELEKGRGTRTTAPQLQNGSLQNLRYFGHLLWLDGHCWYWKNSRRPSTQRMQKGGCLKSEEVHSSKYNYSYIAF